MNANFWPWLILLSGLAFCSSLNQRFPHARFYGARLNIAAARSDTLELWYKPATYYYANEQIACSPWPRGGTSRPEQWARPAWGAYTFVASFALAVVLTDAGALNSVTTRVFSFEVTAPLLIASLAGGLWASLRAVGPRFSQRVLLALITVVAAILALALRH